jgi:hypothetical protein
VFSGTRSRCDVKRRPDKQNAIKTTDILPLAALGGPALTSQLLAAVQRHIVAAFRDVWWLALP